MFRLFQLHADRGVPRIEVDPDGYASERAALARYRATPATYFGVGRFDAEDTLAEVIMDTVCGPLGDCPRPVSAVHAETFQRLCDTCSFGLEVLTVPELSSRLGIAVRLLSGLGFSAPSDGPGRWPCRPAPGRHCPAPPGASAGRGWRARARRSAPGRDGRPRGR